MPDRSIGQNDPSSFDQSRFNRLMDLLADKALFGLEDDEQQELEQLLNDHPHIAEDDFDLAAAAIARADLTAELMRKEAEASSVEDLPDSVKESLLAKFPQLQAPGAPHHTSPGKSAESLEDSAMEASDVVTPANRNRQAVQPRQGKENVRELIAWLAAAAALLIALITWLDGMSAPKKQVVAEPLSVSELRDRLVEDADDLIRQDWAINDAAWVNDTDVDWAGDVVWSTDSQEGFMYLNGLAKSKDDQVYQLWIFDRTRPDEFPVDGGTFRIDDESSSTIVPIAAKLPVRDAYLFAITVEQKGGVVVSDRQRLPLLAKLETASE